MPVEKDTFIQEQKDQDDLASALVVDIDGYEGPLDVLLALARDQKVDLVHISILALANQYLVFIAHALEKNLELAADYLVMASWLAYLKSRLLLPQLPDDEEEIPAEELAAVLAFRLQKLEAMRTAVDMLQQRPHLGRDFFSAGGAEGVMQTRRPSFSATLYDLLRAYSDHWRRREVGHMVIEAADLFSVDDALSRFRDLLPATQGWKTLDYFIPDEEKKATLRGRSAVSAHFVAALEMAREGEVHLRQDKGVSNPLYISKAL